MFWEYDKVGNIKSKTDFQGDVTQYLYDSTNRLVSMSNKAYLQVSYHYDPAGRLLNRILSNGSNTSYRYDNDNRLTRLTNTSEGGGLNQSTVYTHDKVGNILTATDEQGTITYGYDKLYRLTSATYPDAAQNISYTYDEVGNRLTKTDNSGVQYYIYNNSGNRLDEIRSGSEDGPLLFEYTYNNDGSRKRWYDVVNDTKRIYHYDWKGRHDQYIDWESGSSTGLSSYFYYDPFDRLIKSESGSSKRKYFLENEHYESVYDADDQIVAKYFRGVVVDEIVSGYLTDQGKEKAHTFYHDHLQSVTALTDHTGEQVETTEYGPFGEMTGVSGSSPNNLKYTGRLYDEITGHYYYRARHYDPETGRFISEDPLGFEAGINFYAYCQSNPVNFNDPSGHDVVTIGPKISVSGWAAKAAHKAYEFISGEKTDVTISGFGLGLAVSFPGLSGGEWDAGGYLTMDVNNNDFGTTASKYGLAKFTGELGWKVGGVRDLRNTNQFEVSGQALLYGGGVEFSYNEASKEHYVSGVKASYGPGAIGGISATPTTALSFRDVQSWFKKNESASGGFVLYPNKPNTNTLQSVYEK
jgi:RHS repeat-associated protein